MYVDDHESIEYLSICFVCVRIIVHTLSLCMRDSKSHPQNPLSWIWFAY